jgi:arabinosaccharide transport system substrate-binding protein
MIRSRHAAAAAMGAMLMASVALTPTTVAQTPTDLSLWVFVDRHGAFLVKQAERWNAANPDRPITVTPSVIDYTQMHDNLLAAFLAGSGAPDLVDIEIGKFARFVKTEDNVHLLDLTDVVAPYLPDLVASRMAPYQAYGKQLGIDYHLGAYLMYYNKPLLDQAGIDADSIKTWDDYVAAGKAFKEKFPDKAWTAVESRSVFSAYGLMYTNGGHVYDADGNLVLNSAENAQALQFMSDLVNVDKIAIEATAGDINSAEFQAEFPNGNIASIWMPQWYMTRFPDNMPSMCGSMIVRPMPLWKEGGFTTTMGGGTGTAVTDQTPEAEQALAKEFLAFAKLTNEAQNTLWNDLGFDPYRNDVYDEAALSETDTPDVADWPSSHPCFNGAVTFQQIKSELGNVAPEYTGPLYPEARTILSEQIMPSIINDGRPAAEALAEAQSLTEAQQ